MGRPRLAATALPLLLPLLLACEAPAPLVIGGPGSEPGRFVRPRGIAARGGRVAVLDTSGRLQRFAADGALERSWPVMPPGSVRGFPLGLLLRPDGGTLVVHTHEAALVSYGPDGKETSRRGNGGVRDGEFCMPQRAVEWEGEVFVSEFGYEPCRRVQVFAPDGRFLRRLGGPGTEAVFQRPMGIAVDAAGVLWVADAGNRLFRLDPRTGRLLSTVGGEGDGPGRFRWPTGLAALPGGGVVVCEAGNHRLQRLDAEGRCLGTFGANGSGPGEFRGPYDLALDPPWLFVADTENHRVQRFLLDRIPWKAPAAESAR